MYSPRRRPATFAGDFPAAAPYGWQRRGPILSSNGGQGMSRPITANALDTPTRRWHASRSADLERTVRSAGRHSRLVRALRILVPLGVVLAFAAFVILTYFNPLAVLDRLPSVSGKLAVQGSKITMELPRIAGITRDKRAYELTAETAVQDITKPDLVELENLHAKMELQDSGLVVITAKSGTYNTKGDSIVLREHVVVTSADGYNAKLREATVDMKKGNVVSDRPVEVKLPTGLLTANGMEIIDSGDLIRFTRGIVLHLEPAQPAQGAKQ
jgi:lipopolysaccharide export system protein LptC